MDPEEQDLKGLDTDEIFKEIGEFGSFQLKYFILISFICTVPALTAYSYVFTSGIPEYRCKLPQYDNDSFEIQNEYHKTLIDLYIPQKNKTDEPHSIFDGCHIKTFKNNEHENNTFILRKCSSWVYSKKYFDETTVSKWNLVCDREPIRSSFSSLYFFGYFGVVIVGVLCDKFGRKPISYILLVLNLLVNILTAVFVWTDSINKEVQPRIFAVLRLASGLTSNVYISGMILAVELVGPSYRIRAANFSYYFYIFGEFLMIFLGYCFRDFRILLVVFAVFSAIYVLYFWAVPESPRYFVIKGNEKGAQKVFDLIAKSNNKEHIALKCKVDFKKNGANDDGITKKLSWSKKIRIALRSRAFLIRLCVSLLNWFGNTFIYDGLSFNVDMLGGNPYLNYLYSAFVELGGVVLSHYALDRFGRKISYIVFLCSAGISLLLILVVPTENRIIVMILALIGKFSISFTFNAVYIVTAEIYPTEIRNTAVSFCSAFSRVGGVIAPYLQLAGQMYWYPLPFLIYGMVAMLAAISYFIYIPETKGKKLSDKFEDIIN